MSYLVNWTWARKVKHTCSGSKVVRQKKHNHTFEHRRAEHRIPASGPVQTGLPIGVLWPVVDPARGANGPMGVNLGPLFRGQNQLLSLLLYVSFHWQTGAQPCQREGTGAGWGEALVTCKQGKARASGSLFCLRKKGAWGGWLHYCLSAVRRVAGGASAASATTRQETRRRLTRERAEWHHSHFLPSPGCLISGGDTSFSINLPLKLYGVLAEAAEDGWRGAKEITEA